ncbi:hypothetical protein [Kribbella sp. CWNU-51]
MLGHIPVLDQLVVEPNLVADRDLDPLALAQAGDEEPFVRCDRGRHYEDPLLRIVGHRLLERPLDLGAPGAVAREAVAEVLVLKDDPRVVDVIVDPLVPASTVHSVAPVTELTPEQDVHDLVEGVTSDTLPIDAAHITARMTGQPIRPASVGTREPWPQSPSMPPACHVCPTAPRRSVPAVVVEGLFARLREYAATDAEDDVQV